MSAVGCRLWAVGYRLWVVGCSLSVNRESDLKTGEYVLFLNDLILDVMGIENGCVLGSWAV
jgi:hypothetical protein